MGWETWTSAAPQRSAPMVGSSQSAERVHPTTSKTAREGPTQVKMLRYPRWAGAQVSQGMD